MRCTKLIHCRLDKGLLNVAPGSTWRNLWASSWQCKQVYCSRTLHITNSRVTLLKLVLYLMNLLISVSPLANVENNEEIWPCNVELMCIKIKNAQHYWCTPNPMLNFTKIHLPVLSSSQAHHQHQDIWCPTRQVPSYAPPNTFHYIFRSSIKHW